MASSTGACPRIAALLGLFLGGGAAGIALAKTLVPGSWLAEAVSFFALPVAFAAGLQAWYGLALLSLVPRLVGWLRGRGTGRPPRPLGGTPQLPGSFVFLPLSSGIGGVVGLVVGLMSSTHPAWQVALWYWLVGTLHGVLAWRLARSGALLLPEST